MRMLFVGYGPVVQAVYEDTDMRKGVQSIEVRRSRGVVVAQSIGRTGRGVKFLIDEATIADKPQATPEFKAKQAAIVDKLLRSDA